MKRKNFWFLIIVIAVLCIIIPAVSGAYNSLSKKEGVQSAKKTDSEQKNKAVSQQTPSQPKETQEPPANEKYIVQEGDNLWGIAQKFQTTVEAIIELNNLPGDVLEPGQELLIPDSGTQLRVQEALPSRGSRGMNDSGRYIVQEGDSLWVIAESFKIPVEILKELNGLTSDRVFPGQPLLVSGTIRSSNQQVNSASPAEQKPITSAVPKSSPAPKPNPAPTPAPQPKSNVVKTAKQYLGVPYVYGGNSPKGFDCSGFVYYVYQQHGIGLPRVASDQAGVGTKVNTPASGDLVFFSRVKGGSGGIGHVGIYTGNNTFIHSNTNQGVIITSMDSQWYQERYVGAKRI